MNMLLSSNKYALIQTFYQLFNMPFHYHQLNAEESVLQLLPRPTLSALRDFNLEPSPKNASRLATAPAIYDVLQFHSPAYPKDLLAVLGWLYERGVQVLQTLIVHYNDDRGLINLGQDQPEDWRKVSGAVNCTNSC